MPAQVTASTDGQLPAMETLSLSDGIIPGTQPDCVNPANLDYSLLDEILLEAVPVHQADVTQPVTLHSAHTASVMSSGLNGPTSSGLTQPNKVPKFWIETQPGYSRESHLPVPGKHKALFGNKGWLGENPEAAAKYLRRKAEQEKIHCRKLGIPYTGTGSHVNSTSQSVSNSPPQDPSKIPAFQTKPKFDGPVSLNPEAQAAVFSALDVIIRAVASLFLTLQFQAGLIARDTFDSVRTSWAQLGNLPVDGFNFDQFHQMRLLLQNRRFVTFLQKDADDILRGWPYLAAAAATTCALEMRDSELRVRLRDAQRLLGLLGASEEKLQICRDVAKWAMSKMTEG